MTPKQPDPNNTADRGWSPIDLAIIGGGLSGLSLGLALLEKGVRANIVILEPRSEYVDDRSWSFWAPIHHRWTDLVDQSWSSWSYGRWSQTPQTHQDAVTPYQLIRSHRFYGHALDAIGASTTIKLVLNESVEQVERGDGDWLIHTAQQTYRTHQVVDTRPPSLNRFNGAQLFQSFLGHEIRAPGAFDPHAVELMTDMKSDRHGFYFTYCLPLSTDHALVEATRFSHEQLDIGVLEHDLEELKVRRGWLQHPVDRVESAVLPMGLVPKPSPDPSYVIAGTAGGALRPASGYGFLRIQRWAQMCATAFCQHGQIQPHPHDSMISSWMDKLFLDVLRRHPEATPDLFFHFYHHNSPARLIRFLSDQSSLVDKYSVITSLPKRPFLNTIMKR